MKNTKRSPIKDKPLRNPGQSLDEQWNDLVYDKIFAPIVMALFLVLFAGLEWWRYFFPQQSSPVLGSAIALLGIGYATLRFWRTWPQIHSLRQGLEGEKAVGQYLEQLRQNGYQVFHDVIGTDFNVDHVLIGPAGVFTIETKTFSKRPSTDAKVIFDGERIVVDGQEPDRDPVIQARAQATWLRELLVRSTGHKFSVWPVILFPGWWVEQSKDSKREVWVLEPKALPGFLTHAPEIMAARKYN